LLFCEVADASELWGRSVVPFSVVNLLRRKNRYEAIEVKHVGEYVINIGELADEDGNVSIEKFNKEMFF